MTVGQFYATPSGCEWQPGDDRAAFGDEPAHAVATLAVGKRDTIHLCAECADLPRFKRRKRWPLKAREVKP